MCRILPFLFLLFLVSCRPKGGGKEGEAIPLRYATLLTMEEADSFTLVTVKDAWHAGQVLGRYVLVPSARPLPVRLPAGMVVRTPLCRAVVTTSVHAALLCELGAARSIVGLTDTAYIIAPEVKALLRGGVRSMGTALNPDLELLRAARPDAVFLSPFENAGHGALDRLGVPLIECADYMETSPLARAEWMRFYGRLVGRGAAADSLFRKVENRYKTLKAGAFRARSPRPAVMCDLLTGGTWYQPGGGSVTGTLIADAGGRYLWADRRESGSLPLNLESVFARARRADIWLVKYGQNAPLTYAQMARDCPQYRQFRPWQTRRVFACNTFVRPFYETIPFHPDLILRDLVCIFHPEVSPAARPVWYTPLP